MKKLGLGVQEFSKFKKNNLIYVDKTELIHRLIDDGSYYFLSRPRRFGKSLLVSTMEELFSGNKESFEHCWIYDQWDWEKKYPVITLSFSKIAYQEQGLKKALERLLCREAAKHGIQLESTNYSDQFLELIETLGNKIPVVVLIDEYDKPIIDYLEQSQLGQAQENRKILKTLYAGIKDQDRYLRFFFMTGVSKFSKVSIFSDLNHLTDITISRHFSGISGYTKAEIQQFYPDYLTALSREFACSEAEIMEDVTQWYNGYSWDGRTFVFNPYSIISLFFHQMFKNFWFETGSPTFLIKKIKEADTKIHEPINREVNENTFIKYDIDHLNTTAIMFQAGYLTIKDADWRKNTYRLDFPNKEVRDSFLNFAVEHYADSSPDEMSYITELLLEALACNEMERFLTALQALFSSITVKQLDKVKEYEGFYHSVIYIVLRLLGIKIQCEVQSSFGSTDAVIMNEEYIYVLEFKMGTAASALEQIKQRKYHAPYLADKRELVLVGFGFDKTERNLTEVLVEQVVAPSSS
ncbi:PD-(D/E)XK nuclease superfamily protein [Candidatus Electrothrix marina]|uniref:PD-(D/E)XK nuclease superfamily protein n=1 Tax=Candidatus Electrothrix marina TaxID=1859130 RepID=A0A444JF79_9BACT|nr:PD-(D/E)XK nuclease superfamily protein [Candidatus Electrothrix marina]